MRQLTTFLFVFSVASRVGAQDFCAEVCASVPEACSARDGSYCKGVMCHELYWQTSAKTSFAMNRDRTGQTEFPVSCSEAHHFLIDLAVADQSSSTTRAGVTRTQSSASAPSGVGAADGLPELGSRGMVNLGNTCYFNSIVQALGHSLAFRDMVLGTPDASPDTRAGVVFNELKAVFAHMWGSDSREAIDPSPLFHALYAYGGRAGGDMGIFEIGSSDDANIAMGILLNAVDEAMLRITHSYTAMETAVGRTCSVNRTCLRCNGHRLLNEHRNINMVDLNGVVDGANFVDVLRESLISYQESECTNCGGNTIQASRTHLGETNAVNACLVVFTLNRYALEGRINTSIVIPEILDMEAVSGEENQLYGLVAVVRHDGGHFTADVHHPEGNVWIRTDDSRVAPLTEPDMMGPQPFVLLYEAI